ncbi:PKD domain-containing protein, partial [Spongiivirga citrea]
MNKHEQIGFCKRCTKSKLKKIYYTFLLTFFTFSLWGQQINFGSTGLVGESVINPTSLEFGPNGKLYVSQQNGIIWEFTIERDDATPGSGTYTVIESNSISLVQTETPNHNDDGTINTSNTRQITGLLTAGTAQNPILYVTSSDSRIGGGGGAGNDTNLDTNSGVISRLTWNGSSWDKVDLVRGLPRCEENHSTNGLDLFTLNGNTYLLVQQGGNTNQGSPSNNFAGSTEFYLAGALLIVNVTQLEQIESQNGGPYIDSRQGSTAYIYDLPTVDDPERINIDNTSPSFPYPLGHPMYNATIDLGDPFGGNNGLNQAFSETGGPVQIFSPGYRNAYDIVITEGGLIYTGDNGPNGGWGGTPRIYDSNGNLKGQHYNTTYEPQNGDYVTNEFNIENGRTHGDALHYVGTINDANGTYYGGHPVPIRAFPEQAGVYKYEYNGTDWDNNGSYNWADIIQGVSGYFNTNFTIADFPNDTRQGEYLADNSNPTKVNILDVVNSSTNGICEYTATNFSGVMQGDILTASFNGNINRYSLNAAGDGTTLIDNGFLSGFGNIPLDVIAQGDNDPFPGTIWAATYGADNITIFEPNDFGDCFQPGDTEYDPLADYDGDGYTNQDEIDNGTNHCSAGSSPNDNDGDLISDLNDPDDDNDGIPDLQDAFSIDAQNGTNKNLPVLHPFWNNDPGTGFLGLGFMGLMLDPNGATDYLTQFDIDNMSFGGAGGKATVDAVTSGTAEAGSNTQQYAFQFGVNVDSNSNTFTVHSKIETPFGGVPPLVGQSYGIYIGNGDQDNYLKVALMNGVNPGDSVDGIEVTLEENGIVTSNTYDIPNLLAATGVDIYISINPSQNSAQVFYSLNSGLDITSLGGPITIPASFLDASDNKGMAVGLIATSGSSSSPYIATWDFINITEDQPSALVATPSSLDFGQLDINSSAAELNITVVNQGGPADGPIDVSAINITGFDASLFSTSASVPFAVGAGSERIVPITVSPDDIQGLRQANLEIVHSGQNSPLIIPLSVTLAEPVITGPLVRISVGSLSAVTATDDGPDWESNPNNGAYNGVSYSVNTGSNANSSIQYANRHSSIPAYIDQATFGGLFNRERYDVASGEEMEFTIPVQNGTYTVNLFMANNYGGTANPGDRIFDILVEGVVVEDNLDLVATYGHKVAVMLSYPATVTDGVLSVSFGHVVENPLINAIEILGGGSSVNQAPSAIAGATPLSGETPLEVTFTGSGSTDDNGIVSYSWDFGDGGSSTDADPVYSYTGIGVFSATLTVTDGGGLSDSASVQITVNDVNSGPLTIDPIADQFNNVNDTPTVSASASGGDPNENVTYSITGQPAGVTIEPTNGQIIGVIQQAALTGGPNSDGVHTVTVTAAKPGSVDVSTQFSWTISPSGTLAWFDKDEDENYTARHECSFVQAGDKFIMFGGRENARTLDIYDYGTNTWASLTNSAPIEFNHFQAVEYQGLIWVIGAFKDNNFPDEVPEDHIWSFNPATQEWIQGPEIPQSRKRGSTGLVVNNDKFYILAGNTNGHSGGFVPWFDEYDPATGIWTALQDAPRARDHFHAAVIDGKLYAASGRLSGGTGGVFGPVIPEVDVYDFSTSTWSTLPVGQNLPTPRAAAVVTNFQNKLLVAGGEVPGIITTALTTTEIYDPVTGSWDTGTDLNHGRHGTQGIVSGNGVFVAAGSPNRGGGNQKNMEFYGEDSPTGAPSIASILNADASVQFTPGEQKNTLVNISGGNIGIIIKSISIAGTDASEFSIQSGDLTNALLNANSQHTINIVHTGSQSNRTADLIISYNDSSTHTITLNVSDSGANQAPVAVANATPQSGLVPLQVTFTGSSSTDDVGITSYAWNFQDGNTSNLADPTHTFNNIGTYNVTLTVTDGEGLTDSTIVTIVVDSIPVNQPPVAIASATPLSGTVPLEVSFTGSNSTDDVGITSYSWNFQDG